MVSLKTYHSFQSDFEHGSHYLFIIHVSLRPLGFIFFILTLTFGTLFCAVSTARGQHLL